MAYTSTPGGQYVGVLPDANEDPNIPGDLAALAKAIEKRAVGIYATTAARDAAATAMGVEEGMFAFVKADDSFWYYTGTAWTSFPPRQQKIGSGTTVPTASDPNYVNGDVFFKV
jgi:hypothetical protein